MIDNREFVTEDNGTYWMQFYMPNGVRVSFTRPMHNDAFGEAFTFAAMMLERGATVEAPGLSEGENSDTIVTVMRRQKSDGTPIIDYFTEWGQSRAGKEAWGTYKYLHQYMNNDQPELIENFLKISGFKSIEQIPLYDAQAPLKRTEGKSHPKEAKVPTPFKLIREQGDEKVGSDGKPYRPWEFVGYQPLQGIVNPVGVTVSHPRDAVGTVVATTDDKPATPKNAPVEDTDTTWNQNKETVKQVLSPINLFTGMPASEMLDAVKFVTGQLVAGWSELQGLTSSDVWAAVLITKHNQDGTKARAAVKDDLPKLKAVNHWLSKLAEDISF